DPNYSHYTADASIMRYPSGNDVYVTGKEIVTPMIYDIALLQSKYGANIDYTPPTLNTIEISGASIARTLWEGGALGHDEIDASGVFGAAIGGVTGYNIIDLRGGFDENNNPRFSQVG